MRKVSPNALCQGSWLWRTSAQWSHSPKNLKGVLNMNVKGAMGIGISVISDCKCFVFLLPHQNAYFGCILQRLSGKAQAHLLCGSIIYLSSHSSYGLLGWGGRFMQPGEKPSSQTDSALFLMASGNICHLTETVRVVTSKPYSLLKAVPLPRENAGVPVSAHSHSTSQIPKWLLNTESYSFKKEINVPDWENPDKTLHTLKSNTLLVHDV